MTIFLEEILPNGTRLMARRKISKVELMSKKEILKKIWKDLYGDIPIIEIDRLDWLT
jgi:hypothetical protein